MARRWQNIVNAYAYGDIWARPGMERKTRSLIVLAMTAAIEPSRRIQSACQWRAGTMAARGGIREVLLLIALYCGIPAIERRASYCAGTFAEKGIT